MGLMAFVAANWRLRDFWQVGRAFPLGGHAPATLMLSRKARQRIVIGGNIVVKVARLKGDQVKLGSEAP
jgi:hypothetical protein